MMHIRADIDDDHAEFRVSDGGPDVLFWMSTTGDTPGGPVTYEGTIHLDPKNARMLADELYLAAGKAKRERRRCRDCR